MTARPARRLACLLACLLLAVSVLLPVSACGSPSSDGGEARSARSVSREGTPDPSTDGDACAQAGQVLDGTLDAAPEVTWRYTPTAGAMPYPVSDTAGPARTDETSGVRSCFARTPEGAAVAGANMAAMLTDTSITTNPDAYLSLFDPSGSRFADLSASVRSSGGAGGASDVSGRAQIQGVRLLAYDGATARVDLAWRVSAVGRTLLMGQTVSLVWSGGDWRIACDDDQPFSVAQLPSLDGYLAWTER